MFAAAAPPSPGRRNLDYAFPPFASGLPSVYERAGFDVNPGAARSRSGSRSSSRAGSMRKGSFSGSAVGSNASSFKSQTSLGGALRTRDGSPHTPASEFSTFEAELPKPVAPVTEPRRPSSPLATAATLPERAPAPAAATPPPPAISVDMYAGNPGPLATSAASGAPARAAYNPYNTATEDAVHGGAPLAPRGSSSATGSTAPSAQNNLQTSPQNSSPALDIDGYSADGTYAKSATSASDPQAHSQSASNASTATSDFEFLDTKPALNTMPLNVKPAWAQAQDRVYATQPMTQPMPQPMPQQPMPQQPTPQQQQQQQPMPQQQQMPQPVPATMHHYGPGAPYVDAPQPYRPQATRVGAGQPGGLLGVPQHDFNRMSTTSSIYSNRASSMPQLARDAAARESIAGSSGSQYDESESSVSFDFAEAHRPHSVPQADTSLNSQRSGGSQSSGKKRRYCRGCLNAIVGKSVRSRDGTLSGRWHRECFMCTRCETPLTGASSDIHVHEDQPFCPSCYHVVAHTTCRMCGKGIEGSCLEATADVGAPALLYHVNCLRCAECQIHLQQSYFEVDGATYCAEHAFTSLPQNTEVHKRFTQFMMI